MERISIDWGRRPDAYAPGETEGASRDGHDARYQMASGMLLPGDAVLDAACGIGYGAAILNARGDVDYVGVDQAASVFHDTFGVFGEFIAADLTHWTPDFPFDVGVSFETIEHLESYDNLVRVLQQARRTIVISAPIGPTALENPHHHHDFDTVEDVVGLFVNPAWRLFQMLNQPAERAAICVFRRVDVPDDETVLEERNRAAKGLVANAWSSTPVPKTSEAELVATLRSWIAPTRRILTVQGHDSYLPGTTTADLDTVRTDNLVDAFKMLRADNEIESVIFDSVLRDDPAPRNALRTLHDLLPEDATVVVVVPNVTHADFRLAQLSGPSGGTGFNGSGRFTLEEIHNLLEEVAWTVVDVVGIVVPAGQTDLAASCDVRFASLRQLLAADPRGETTAFAVVASKRRPVDAELVRQVRRLRQRAETAEHDRARCQRAVDDMRTELQRCDARLQRLQQTVVQPVQQISMQACDHAEEFDAARRHAGELENMLRLVIDSRTFVLANRLAKVACLGRRDNRARIHDWLDHLEA